MIFSYPVFYVKKILTIGLGFLISNEFSCDIYFGWFYMYISLSRFSAGYIPFHSNNIRKVSTFRVIIFHSKIWVRYKQTVSIFN